MARFFIEGSPGTEYTLSGEDGRHIARSLRMRVGETLTLCDGCGQDFTCEITAISGDDVTVSVLHQQVNPAEPTLQVTVYQGLPKSDKMDWIAQKIVESGAVRLVPVMTTRCISRPDGKAAEKKVQRWQKIAEEAAKQSGRGIIPQVAPLTEFAKAVEEASQQGAVFFFYEGGGDNLNRIYFYWAGRWLCRVGSGACQSAWSQNRFLGTSYFPNRNSPDCCLVCHDGVDR